MNFFGLTYLGGSEYAFAPHLRQAELPFSDDEILRCYDSYVKNLPHNMLLLSDIRALLLRLHMTSVPELEVKLFLEALQPHAQHHPISPRLEKTAEYVSRDSFAEALKEVRAKLAALADAPGGVNSHEELSRRKLKGDAAGPPPQEAYRVPVTTSQAYGWHTQLPHERVERKPMKSCAETLFAAEMVKSNQY
jgi:hypothetical protein